MVIALVQTYFAVQTRKQEISEKEYSMLTEDEKRFYQRDLTRQEILEKIRTELAKQKKVNEGQLVILGWQPFK